ncbi:Na/Pi symporter [Erysipelothrix enhydrae]|uniref:Na/Pi cotransporter family protein n=1 Tax=Erysipelothrix enhydrae TaxID=2890314 RepID=UPI002B244466|nr:Na/Pi symporter [Erysipelothrix sp. 4322-04]WRB86237.1 Na/Pi symporter [Erysipelothrix sp. 4322-04]
MILIGEVAQFSDIAFNVILGGFGMFLLGIKLLGDGFKDAAGSKIRDYIERYTGNLLSAILVGTVITALMQSSTAATVISISLVRAGLMSLEAAIGISVGANLGTTVTALMIGLNIEAMGYYFVFIGALILLTKKRYKSVGQIFFGLGITFVGLELMSDQLIILQDVPQFEAYLVKMSDNPWLALLAGTIGTAVINSSMAVIALVQKIYAGGGMSMVAASAFVYGSNVGTTLTAILASVGGSVSTKRAGWFHALYNVIGALITMLFIYPYSNFILYINGKMGGSPEMAVGINHFVFNLIWVVGIIPFIPACIRLLKILIPGEDRIKEREKIEALDYELIKTFPDGAFQLAQKQTL